MRNKRLISITLTMMIALAFSVFALAPIGASNTFWYVNSYIPNLYSPQLSASDVGSKQGPYNLTVSFNTYYIQESGDLMMFVVLASTPSGIVPGMVLGNGTTGWHFVPVDYYTPSITLSLEGNVTLFIYGALMKNVWPSGWRTVDECFGLVGLYNPINNETNRSNLVTANGNWHMILIFSVAAF